MTDERYKKIMADLGMPDSRSLLGALKQVANEVAQEYAADNSRLLTALADTEALELGTSERCAKLMEELAARDLVIEQKNAAMHRVLTNGIGPWVLTELGNAIALQPSTEALAERDRKRDAALLRGLAHDLETSDFSVEELADMRESGEWEPELEVK